MAVWWTDIATKHSQSPNSGGAMSEHRGVIVHIADGSYEGTISWQMNPTSDVSSHFVVAYDGRITQMVPCDVAAWTQRDGNGHWLSIENEGYSPATLTDAQISANARIMAKSVAVYGHPNQNCTSPAGLGLGHHSMGAESGYDWGHSQCPGEKIKSQKPEIVSRAGGNDVSANEVWAYDVDPSGGKYSASGAAWTTLNRTDYLANNFAPQTNERLANIEADIANMETVLANTKNSVMTLSNQVSDVESTVTTMSTTSAQQGKTLTEVKWLLLVLLIIIVASAAGVITWSAAS
jgi:hypothetical protein